MLKKRFHPSLLLFPFLFFTFAFGQCCDCEQNEWTYEDSLMWEEIPEFDGGEEEGLIPYNPNIRYVNIREDLLQEDARILWYKYYGEPEVETCVHNAITTSLEYVIKRHLIINENWKESSYPLEISAEQIIGGTTGPANTIAWRVVWDIMIPLETKVILLREDEKLQTSHSKSYYRYDPDDPAWVKILSHERVKSSGAIDNWERIKQLLQNNIPVIMSIYFRIDMDDDNFIEWNPSGTETNHSVVIIGYDEDYHGGSWIVQNSIGNTNHGGDGIFYLKYAKLNTRHYNRIKEIEVSPSFKNNIRSDWGMSDITPILNLLLLD